MKFNRKKLEELTLEKIDEVNDEAGYRKYLEVPEMVEIIASIMEEKMKAMQKFDADVIQRLRDYIDRVEKESEQWEACADNLVDYAHEFVAHLSTWGKGYDRYDKDIKKAEDAIEAYKKLKNDH
jgi:septation ring formation regulator EzrA